MEDNNFNAVIEEVTNRVGHPVKLVEWEFTLNHVRKDTPKTARLDVTFSCERHSFNMELKLVAEHYQDISHYENEINKRLNTLDGYHETVLTLKAIAASNVGKPLPNEGAWKAFLYSVNDSSPTETIVEFIFSREVADGSIESFNRTFNLLLDTFTSFDNYMQELNNIPNILNRPVEINTDYYNSLIPQTTY